MIKESLSYLSNDCNQHAIVSFDSFNSVLCNGTGFMKIFSKLFYSQNICHPAMRGSRDKIVGHVVSVVHQLFVFDSSLVALDFN